MVAAASHDPVVVAVGDIACAPGDTSNSCEQSLTANLASAQHPDAVLPLGDNQYNSGLLSEYTGAGAYGATWGIFNSIAHPTPGNHEYTASSTAAGYFGYFGAAVGGSTPSAPYYSYNLGTWHIVSLDSSCSDSGCGDVVAGETSAAQTAWLQSDLAAHPAACTLAYWHHPRFSASWTNDSPGTGPLFSALYNAHADVVVSGHDHVYERYAQQDPTAGATTSGVREFVSGTGGENLFNQVTTPANLQVFDQNDFGVLVLTLHATSYDWAFKRLNGTVVDSGTTACHGSTGSASARAARAAPRRARMAGWSRRPGAGVRCPAAACHRDEGRADRRIRGDSPHACGRRCRHRLAAPRATSHPDQLVLRDRDADLPAAQPYPSTTARAAAAGPRVAHLGGAVRGR